MKPERPTKTEMTYSAIMIVVIFGSHIMAFCTFGATFWIDSLAYISLGDALFDPVKLRIFYDGIGHWSYSYLGPGVPLLWSGLQFFPTNLQWPAMAILQHSVAAFSCWLAFAWAIRPCLLSLAGVFVLSLLPFYQSGHQMLMTESLAASLLLIAVASAIRLTTRPWSEAIFVLLLGTLFLVTQFRSYFGIMVAVLGAVVLFRTGRWRSRRLIILIAVGGASILAFPTYRFLAIRQFFMPSFGSNALVWALWADPEPSTNLISVFEQADLPPEYTAREILANGLDYKGAALIARHWRQEGLTDAQIDNRTHELAKQLHRDGMRPTINRFLYGLASCGFLFPYKLGPATYQVVRGKSMEAEWNHQSGYYKWFSWTGSADYKKAFNFMFRAPQTHIPSSIESQQESIVAFEPHVKAEHEYFRDPLLLSAISIDVWGLLGLMGVLMLCFRRNSEQAFILLIPLAINFLATASAGVPNVRYAYALIPIYFLAGTMGLESLRNPRYLTSE